MKPQRRVRPGKEGRGRNDGDGDESVGSPNYFLLTSSFRENSHAVGAGVRE